MDALINGKQGVNNLIMLGNGKRRYVREVHAAKEIPGQRGSLVENLYRRRRPVSTERRNATTTLPALVH